LITVVLILVFINSNPIIGEYIVLDYQSIKVLGKVLLNEYMVPFDASVLLLVAMIGTVLLSKKKNRNNEQYFK
jgi:NADH-quinone oxidoreductase subunit J